MVNLGVNIRISETGAVNLKKTFEGIGDSAKKTTTVIQSLRAAFSALVAGFGISEIFKAADTYQVLQNRLGLVTTTLSQQSQMWSRLSDISRQTYTSLENTTQLYVKAAYALKGYGKTAEEAAEFTQLFQKAAVLSGSSVQTTSQAVYQFTQALNKGKLDGDEFKSVLEGLPYVAQTIQNELKVTRAELYAMSEAGQISVQRVVNAFFKAAKVIRDDFGKVIPTVGMALLQLGNSWLELVGYIQNSTGVFTVIAYAILFVADNLGILLLAISPVAVAFTYLAGRTAIGLTILAFQQMAAVINLTVIPAFIRLAIAIWSNPLIAIPTAIAAAVAAILYFTGTLYLLGVAWEYIKTAVSVVWDVIVQGVTFVVSSLVEWFTNLSIVQRAYELLGIAASSTLSFIQSAYNGLVSGLMVIFSIMSKSVIPIWQEFKPLVVSVYDAISELIELVNGTLVKTFVDMWNVSIKPLWIEWKDEIQGVWDLLKDVAKYVSVGLYLAFKVTFETITKIIRGVIGVVQALINIIRTAISLAKTLSGMGGGLGGSGGSPAPNPGFATGGSFKVGGTGAGRDKTPVHFRANRGEEVQVRTRKQQRDASSVSGENIQVDATHTTINVLDAESVFALMASRRGRQVQINNIKFDKQQINQALGAR